jgi:hypothetical protein
MVNINKNITKYIINPNDYINGWKLIKNNINLIQEIELNNMKWLYSNVKNNKNIMLYGNKLNYNIKYLLNLTNNFQNITVISLENNILGLLYYNYLTIKFNCSKVKQNVDLTFLHNIIYEKEEFINHLFYKTLNISITKNINSSIIFLPIKIENIEPTLTISQYYLKPKIKKEIPIYEKIYDYDNIINFDAVKLGKINLRLYELYILEINKYKISINLTNQEFNEKYLNNEHKIYFIIINGIIEDFIIFINDDIMKLNFYTVNNITINDWIIYVDDEILINEQMENKKLLCDDFVYKKTSEKYVYFYNIYPKKIKTSNYAIVFY